MSILEVTEFAGKAQVMGAVREVMFSSGTLKIGGLTLDEVHKILNHLAIGLHSVTLPGVPKDSDASSPSTPAPAKPAKKPALRAVPEKPVEDDLPGDLGQNGAGPTPKAEVSKNGNGGHDDATLSAKLADLSRFSDVVATLVDNGISSEDEIVETCKRLKGQVKVIARLGSDDAIKERVPRVLETLEVEA